MAGIRIRAYGPINPFHPFYRDDLGELCPADIATVEQGSTVVMDFGDYTYEFEVYDNASAISRRIQFAKNPIQLAHQISLMTNAKVWFGIFRIRPSILESNRYLNLPMFWTQGTYEELIEMDAILE